MTRRRAERCRWLWLPPLLLAAGAAPAQPASPGTAATVPAAPAAPASASASRAALSPPSIQAFRPSGPVEISADRAELTHGNTMVYSGHVRLTSDTLTLEGTRMQVQQSADGQLHAVIDGDPAQLHHAGRGSEDPPVSAQARELIYDSRSASVELMGDAKFRRGDNQITGEDIRYDVAQRSVQASGGASGQVHIVIQPPPGKGSTPPATPATGASAAAPASTPATPGSAP